MNTFVRLKHVSPEFYLTRAGWVDNIDGIEYSDGDTVDGYLKYVKLPVSGEPADGEVTVFRFTVSGSTLTRETVFMNPDDPRIVPPRTYRRSWLAQWLFAHDLLNSFTELLSGSAQMKMMWDYCTEFDSDHPMWPQFSAAVKSGLGLTDAGFAEFLSYGEHGK